MTEKIVISCPGCREPLFEKGPNYISPLPDDFIEVLDNGPAYRFDGQPSILRCPYCLAKVYLRFVPRHA